MRQRSLVDLGKQLASAGIDPAIIAIATGSGHPAFAYRCEAVIDPKVENGGHAPQGPAFTTLWECCDSVTGFWKRADRIEFIEFSIEAPEQYEVVGRSAQGLFAWTFFWLVEDEDWHQPEAALARLREAASSVAFVHLDDVMRVQKEQGQDLDAPAKYLSFANSL